MNFTDNEVKLISALGISDRVLSLGYVDDAELMRLYQKARVVVLASSQEGYGLPMREALALGAPLVAPDLDITKEVCGDAAHLFKPGDYKSLEKAIRTAWTNPRTVSSETKQKSLAGWNESARVLLQSMSMIESMADDDTGS
jgi:glycosyltransferase involved in cell wall biosynthesis